MQMQVKHTQEENNKKIAQQQQINNNNNNKRYTNLRASHFRRCLG